jgi:hypothetical protein
MGLDSDDDSYEDDSGKDQAHALTELDGRGTWGRYEQHRGHPVKAIVKELMGPGYEPLQAQHFSQMWPQLEELHRLGIVVRDVHGGNYMDGKLIDFSRAWTMYHPCLDRIDLDTLQEILLEDTIGLQDLLSVWLNRHRHPEKVEIPQSLCDCAAGKGGNYGTDPRKYNWGKWEQNVGIADAYVAEKVFIADGGRLY